MDDDSAAEAEEQPSGNEEQSSAAADTTQTSNVIVTPAAEVSIPDASARNSALLSRRQASNPGSPEIASVSNAIDVPPRKSGENRRNLDAARTQTPDGERLINGEGPLTPRNDAGPFILDGSAGRGRRVVAINEITENSS
jgi:hypothetical protein